MSRQISQAARVAIIGAGPAGCAAACALGREHLAIDLYERGLPGKDKPCGDAYSLKAIQLLENYGVTLDDIRALGGYPTTQTDLYHHDTYLLRFASAGWVVPRAQLDQRCRDIAAQVATLCYETTVTNVAMTADSQFRVTTRTRDKTAAATYDAVILANGSGSLLARRWGIAGEPVLGASLSTYATGPVPEGLRFQVDDAYSPGYAWVFPSGDGRINLGVCALEHCSGQLLRGRATAFAAEWQIMTYDGWRGGGEAYWSGKGTTWHHAAGLVSCGDAAGIVDPSSGEGITEALLSGDYAGKTIARYLHDQRDARHLAAYSQWMIEYCAESFRSKPERQIWDSLCGRHHS